MVFVLILVALCIAGYSIVQRAFEGRYHDFDDNDDDWPSGGAV